MLPTPGVKLIKEFEGCYLSAYPDPLTGAEPITIGYGSVRKRDGSKWKLGDRISQQEANDLLEFQLTRDYLPSLQKIPVWDELNVNQQGALLSFGYNLGQGFFGASGFNSITKMLQTKNWGIAEETFIKYRNPGSRVEEGLKRRRQEEAKLFLKSV